MAQNRLVRLQKMLEQIDPSGKAAGLEATLESRIVSTEGMALESQQVGVERMEANIALESLDLLHRGREIDAEQQFVLEAIVMPYHRPVVDIVGDYIRKDQLTTAWQQLGLDTLRPWITKRVRSIGRINVPNLPSLPYAGTGFIVGDGLLMTNRHVASIFAAGLGTRSVAFQSGQSALVDFYHEHGAETSETLTVERVIMIHPWWDMALLKVRGLGPNRTPLKLSTADPATLQDKEVIVVGYPGYDPSGDEEFQRIQNRIFRGTYYVKRFQPGLFRVRRDIASYRQNVSAVTHDCSTLGGNSGSAVIEVETGNVVGLHFAGEYLVDNFAVSPFDLAQDSRVVDAGVNFVGQIEPRGDFYGPVWRTADAVESSVATQNAAAGPNVQSAASSQPPPSTGAAMNLSGSGDSVHWTIPLQVSISIGTPTLQTPSSSTTAAVSTRPDEGLFARQRPAILLEAAQSFSVASLTAANFDWRVALSLALASKVSYEDAATIHNTAIQSWGLQTCEFIDVDDTQCFVASSANAVLIAFRGTESLGDWLGNLNLLSTTRDYGTVHRGFLAAFQVVDSQLRSILSPLAGRPVLLTGHSLGGALASIAAAEWRGRVPISGIYTYGQPAVGKGAFPEFIRRHYGGKFIRFVNDDDIVPRVPPTYDHVGRLIHFDVSGDLESVAAGGGNEAAFGPTGFSRRPDVQLPMLTEVEFDHMRAQLLEQQAQAKTVGVESLEAPVLEGFFPSFSDHRIDNYIAKIAVQAGQ